MSWNDFKRYKWVLGGGVLVILVGIFLALPFRIPGDPLIGFWRSDHAGSRYCEGKMTYISFWNGKFRYDEATSSPCSYFGYEPTTFSYTSAQAEDGAYLIGISSDRHSENLNGQMTSPNDLVILSSDYQRLSLFQALASLFSRSNF